MKDIIIMNDSTYNPSINIFDLGEVLKEKLKNTLENRILEAGLGKVRNWLEIYLVERVEELSERVFLNDDGSGQLCVRTMIPFDLTRLLDNLLNQEYHQMLSKLLSLRLNCQIKVRIYWETEYDPCRSKKYLETEIIISDL